MMMMAMPAHRLSYQHRRRLQRPAMQQMIQRALSIHSLADLMRSAWIQKSF